MEVFKAFPRARPGPRKPTSQASGPHPSMRLAAPASRLWSGSLASACFAPRAPRGACTGLRIARTLHRGLRRPVPDGAGHQDGMYAGERGPLGRQERSQGHMGGWTPVPGRRAGGLAVVAPVARWVSAPRRPQEPCWPVTVSTTVGGSFP